MEEIDRDLLILNGTLNGFQSYEDRLGMLTMLLKETSGDSSSVWQAIAHLQIEYDAYGAAKEAVERWLEVDSTSPDAWCLQGVICQLNFDPESAISHWHQALNFDDNHLDSLISLYRIYIEHERWFEALDYIDRILGLSWNEDRDLFLKKAMCLRKLGRFEEALNAIDLYIELSGEDELSIMEKIHNLKQSGETQLLKTWQDKLAMDFPHAKEYYSSE